MWPSAGNCCIDMCTELHDGLLESFVSAMAIKCFRLSIPLNPMLLSPGAKLVYKRREFF